MVACIFLGLLTMSLLLFGQSRQSLLVSPATVAREWQISSEARTQLRNLLQDTVPGTGDIGKKSKDGSGKTKLLAVVGVQTGFQSSSRRQALRESWFPATQEEADKLEAKTSILYRFVIGHSIDEDQEAEVDLEMSKSGACIRLPLVEAYLNLPTKTFQFLQYVHERYNARYVVKIDDDAYLRTDRLPPIINQWTRQGADYIACMTTGPVLRDTEDAHHKNFEPQHKLVGSDYFTHASGPCYVLSNRAVSIVARLSSVAPQSLRFFRNEDVTVGAWMLAMNVTHMDDRRLCDQSCGDATLAVWDFNCGGLCNPSKRLIELHADPQCHSPVLDPEGVVPQLPAYFRFHRVKVTKHRV